MESSKVLVTGGCVWVMWRKDVLDYYFCGCHVICDQFERANFPVCCGCLQRLTFSVPSGSSETPWTHCFAATCLPQLIIFVAQFLSQLGHGWPGIAEPLRRQGVGVPVLQGR